MRAHTFTHRTSPGPLGGGEPASLAALVSVNCACKCPSPALPAPTGVGGGSGELRQGMGLPEELQ